MWKILGFDFCFWVLVHCSLFAWIWKFSAQTPGLLDCGGSVVVFLCKNVGFGVLELSIASIAFSQFLLFAMKKFRIREMKKFSTTLPMKARIFCYTYYRG